MKHPNTGKNWEKANKFLYVLAMDVNHYLESNNKKTDESCELDEFIGWVTRRTIEQGSDRWNHLFESEE